MTAVSIPIRVSVTGRIDSGSGQPDIIHNEYPAEYMPHADGFSIAYAEAELDAHIKIDYAAGRVLMERSGSTVSRMEFIAGRTINAEYILPEGAFELQTACSALSLNEHAGRKVLRIAYRLLSAGQQMSFNQLMLSFSV